VFEWLTLSNIGSVASILGIGLSLYVIYNVREIRKSYLFTARAPALLKSLRAHSSNIKDLLIRDLNKRDRSRASTVFTDSGIS
jgi:hypothetical protein